MEKYFNNRETDGTLSTLYDDWLNAFMTDIVTFIVHISSFYIIKFLFEYFPHVTCNALALLAHTINSSICAIL